MLNCFNHQTSRRHLHPPPLRRKATLSRRFRRVTRGRWRAERKRPLALDSSRRSSRLARTRTSSSSCSSSSIFMKFEFADLAHHPSTLIILMNWVKLLHSPSFAQSTTRHTYASLTQNLMELTIYIYKLCVRGKRWRGGEREGQMLGCWWGPQEQRGIRGGCWWPFGNTGRAEKKTLNKNLKREEPEMRREGGFRFFKGMFCVVHRGDRHNAVRRRSAFLYKNGVEGDPRKKKKKKRRKQKTTG